jgi:dihydroneopterin aldolase/2-amino-4-hydroxy-6-hydroxymethyldihydropteridine diphosphokinase
MPRVFISIGSNINPEENIRLAVELLYNELGPIRISTIYKTEPSGRPEQPYFYNGVIEAKTDLPPTDLKLSVLRKIEDCLGRMRCEDKYAPRTIDLDLILYDDAVIATDDLILPDPDIPLRPFLAVPIAELSPDLVMPDSGRPIKEIANVFGKNSMEPLLEYTEMLRRDLARRDEDLPSVRPARDEPYHQGFGSSG